MPEISEELLNSYHRTSYLVFPGASSERQRITLRIGKRSPELDNLLAKLGVTSWAFLTAHNPRSIRLEPAENNSRHSKLIMALTGDNYSVLPGKSVADAGDWPDEESALVLGIGLNDAKKVSAGFEQNGFLYGKPGQAIELVLC